MSLLSGLVKIVKDTGAEQHFINKGTQRWQHIFAWNLKLGNGGGSESSAKARLRCSWEPSKTRWWAPRPGEPRSEKLENVLHLLRSHNETELGLSPVLQTQAVSTLACVCVVLDHSWQVYPVTSFDPHGNTNSKVCTDMFTVVYTVAYTPSSCFFAFTCLGSYWKHFKMSPVYTEMKQMGQVPKMCRKLFCFLESYSWGPTSWCFTVLHKAHVSEYGVEEK